MYTLISPSSSSKMNNRSKAYTGLRVGIFSIVGGRMIIRRREGRGRSRMRKEVEVIDGEGDGGRWRS